jgi:hypothetical protein
VLVNAAALVKLPSGPRPEALVWADDRVSRWSLAMAELEMARADGETSAERLAAVEVAATPPSPVMVWSPARYHMEIHEAPCTTKPQVSEWGGWDSNPRPDGL